MENFPAIVASIDKTRIVIETTRGPVLHCELTSGKAPKLGNKGVAVVDEARMQVRFKGPRGAAHLRLIAAE